VTSSKPTIVRIAALGSIVVALAGCPRSNPPFVVDDGGGDAQPFVDTDADGLCDAHEVSRGTRIDDPDTDADGFSDLMEASLGFDPALPASPERDGLVYLREQPGATTSVTFALPVSGMGETFTGAFASARQLFEDGEDATRYFDSAAAIAADPMSSIFMIEGERVLGVNGRTQLVFDVRFRFDDPVVGCSRAYPFQYAVKRDDGRIVAVRRYTLIVEPTDAEAPWCSPRPCF